MKIKRIFKYVFIMICLVTASCGYDDFGEYSPVKYEYVAANIDIKDLKSLYSGEPGIVYDDMIIAGYVTANDRSGNFYRTFILEDITGAIEVRAGLYDLHNIFVTGRYVAVRAKGLTIGSYNEVLQIGLYPHSSGSYQTDYFGYSSVMNRYVYPGSYISRPEPLNVTLPALRDDMCGRLVKVDAIALQKNIDQETGEPLEEIYTWAVPSTGPGSSPQTAYRIFADIYGNEIAVNTSGYANFAGETIPVRLVSVTGILMKGRTDKGRTMYMIKMRDIEDVQIL